MICQYQITFMSFPKNVGQMAVDSVYYRVVGDVEAVTSRTVGRGELRDKQHRSNRCEAFAAWKDQHLHWREDNPTDAKLIQERQRLCWFTKEFTPAIPNCRHNIKR